MHRVGVATAESEHRAELQTDRRRDKEQKRLNPKP